MPVQPDQTRAELEDLLVRLFTDPLNGQITPATHRQWARKLMQAAFIKADDTIQRKNIAGLESILNTLEAAARFSHAQNTDVGSTQDGFIVGYLSQNATGLRYRLVKTRVHATRKQAAFGVRWTPQTGGDLVELVQCLDYQDPPERAENVWQLIGSGGPNGPAITEWTAGRQTKGSFVTYEDSLYYVLVDRADGQTPPGPTTAATYRLLPDQASLADVAFTGSYFSLPDRPNLAGLGDNRRTILAFARGGEYYEGADNSIGAALAFANGTPSQGLHTVVLVRQTYEETQSYTTKYGLIIQGYYRAFRFGAQTITLSKGSIVEGLKIEEVNSAGQSGGGFRSSSTALNFETEILNKCLVLGAVAPGAGRVVRLTNSFVLREDWNKGEGTIYVSGCFNLNTFPGIVGPGFATVILENLDNPVATADKAGIVRPSADFTIGADGLLSLAAQAGGVPVPFTYSFPGSVVPPYTLAQSPYGTFFVTAGEPVAYTDNTFRESLMAGKAQLFSLGTERIDLRNSGAAGSAEITYGELFRGNLILDVTNSGAGSTLLLARSTDLLGDAGAGTLVTIDLLGLTTNRAVTLGRGLVGPQPRLRRDGTPERLVLQNKGNNEWLLLYDGLGRVESAAGASYDDTGLKARVSELEADVTQAENDINLLENAVDAAELDLAGRRTNEQNDARYAYKNDPAGSNPVPLGSTRTFHAARDWSAAQTLPLEATTYAVYGVFIANPATNELQILNESSYREDVPGQLTIQAGTVPTGYTVRIGELQGQGVSSEDGTRIKTAQNNGLGAFDDDDNLINYSLLSVGEEYNSTVWRWQLLRRNGTAIGPQRTTIANCNLDMNAARTEGLDYARARHETVPTNAGDTASRKFTYQQL